MTFSVSIFRCIFDGKWFQNGLQNRSPGRHFGPKWSPKWYTGDLREPSWSRPFSRDEFSMTFWMHFGSFCSLWAPFWLPLGAFWLHFGRLRLSILQRCLSNLGSISAGAFFQEIFGRKPTNEQTHATQSNKPINRPGGMRARALNACIEYIHGMHTKNADIESMHRTHTWNACMECKHRTHT